MIGVWFSTGVIGFLVAGSMVVDNNWVLLVSSPVICMSTCGCDGNRAFVAAVVLPACVRVLPASGMLLERGMKFEACDVEDWGIWGMRLGAWDVCGCGV